MCFFWRKKKKVLKEDVVQEQKVEPMQDAPLMTPQVEINQDSSKKSYTNLSDSNNDQTHETSLSTETKTEEVLDEQVQNGIDAEEKVMKKGTPRIPKYHVSQNKDENSDKFKKWRVRKEGSTKTIKFFDTQKAAIEFAEQLAESAGSSVVIHKVDGSIRKQDYTKK